MKLIELTPESTVANQGSEAIPLISGASMNILHLVPLKLAVGLIRYRKCSQASLISPLCTGKTKNTRVCWAAELDNCQPHHTFDWTMLYVIDEMRGLSTSQLSFPRLRSTAESAGPLFTSYSFLICITFPEVYRPPFCSKEGNRNSFYFHHYCWFEMVR